MKIIFLIGKINYKWSFILIFTSYLSLPKGIKNGSPIKMLPEIRVLPWKFGVCSLEIFEWIRRLHLVRNLSPHVQMIYSLVLKYGFRENPSFTSMFFPIQLPLEIFEGHVSLPNGICSYYSPNSSALHWFTRGCTNPYQPVPTRTNPQKRCSKVKSKRFCVLTIASSKFVVYPQSKSQLVTREIVVPSLRG
jgi:hypothetical protein